MQYWQFSLLMSLFLLGILGVICMRLKLVLGGPVLRVMTAKKKTALFLAGLAVLFALGAVIASVVDLLRGAPDVFMEYYRYQLYGAIPTVIGAVVGFIATFMEGQIREEGIYHRGMHTWEQMQSYSVQDYVVRIVTAKAVWYSGKPKQIKWNLQDQDRLIDVTRALESHGIEKRQLG